MSTESAGEVISEIVPRRLRQVIYLIAAIGGMILAVWQGSDGDWGLFAAGVFASAQALLAVGHISPPPRPQ